VALKLKIAHQTRENKPGAIQYTKFISYPRIAFFSKGSKLTAQKLENKA